MGMEMGIGLKMEVTGGDGENFNFSIEKMLRKRSRPVHMDQNKGHLISDFVLDSDVSSYFSVQKNKNRSFFSIPGLFVGFSTKALFDSDVSKSPTSPLDYKGFSSVGNPCRSPKLGHFSNGPQKSWDFNKVGLGIVDSLNDEPNTSGKSLGFSENRNILFGSQLRINIPSSHNYQHNSFDSKSLPKNIAIYPQTQITSPLPQPSFQGLFVGDQNFEKFSGIKSKSVPISIGSDHGFMGSLSASEIELSEDYTCVISHGPNPRTTDIYGDCILESHPTELADCNKKEEWEIGSPPAVIEFLSFCYFCKKKLEEGKDIYMYRGEKAFCSSSCRSQEILIEEEMENPTTNSSVTRSAHD
ncbi:FCS-Like Zinc finger 8-like [Tasmannia lanceolata]|uniref:FCS-Like Zinc finger 8-like n=1 Tax=Tasmannia lanceolata TaxID=3420 RepID=UPI0040645962